MGALHAGHCHLINTSMAENDHTLVSIFVNPSQFAPSEDLDSYPRTLESDLKMLESAGGSQKNVSAVFIPKVSELYPSGIVLDTQRQKGAFVTVHGCSEQLEGARRPGFFRGVATVVTKLLNIVSPDRVYFGQKDAQQCVVIQNLVRDLMIDTQVRVLATLREPNGLALLSRNAYLSHETKQKSSLIYRGLSAGKARFQELALSQQYVAAAEILAAINEVYSSAPNSWDLEYLAVSHPETLADLDTVSRETGATVSVAFTVPKADGGSSRLIDNIQLIDTCQSASSH